MQIQIKLDELRKKKLFVGLPCYGGQMFVTCVNSLNDLVAAMVQHRIPMEPPYFLSNESLITRARNYIADEFLRSEATHLLFIDADIGFNYKDILTMLHLMDDDADYDVMCLPYPKKVISWEKIEKAVQQGHAQNDPNDLKNFVGDFAFNTVRDIKTFRIDEPVEVMDGGTGLMMIRRKTFEKYREAHPERLYLPDDDRTEHFTGDREIMAFFDCVIDPDSRRYLSEDYFFTQTVRRLGMKVWMCPWARTRHVGTYIFNGDLSAINKLQSHSST